LTFAVHDHEGREYGCSYFDLGKVEEGELQSAFEPYKLKDSDPDEADESEGKEEETADGEDVRLPDVPTEKMVRDQLDKIRPLTDDEFVDDLDDDIEYFCGVFHKGWWSYEWCHNRSIKQFHMSVSESKRDESKAGTNEVRLSVEDIISLGEFKRREISIVGGSGDEFPKIVATDHYEEGEDCEGKQRGAVVSLSCTAVCEIGAPLGASGNAPAQILSIVEDETCRYQIDVCTPLLCADQFKLANKAKSSKKSIRGMIERSLLGTMCMQKQSGW